MDEGLSLKTYVTSKRFELELWDWSQIEDFLKEITLGSRKKASHVAFIKIFHVFFMIFLVLTTFHVEHSSFTILTSHNFEKRDKK